MFDGFGSRAVEWFEGLERDNSKAYFDATRATFQSEVREPFEDLLDVSPPELKTAPRGFPRDQPHVALQRYKSVIAGRRLRPGPDLERRAALEFVAATWRAARPLNAWLGAHVGPSALPRERR